MNTGGEFLYVSRGSDLAEDSRRVDSSDRGNYCQDGKYNDELKKGEAMNLTGLSIVHASCSSFGSPKTSISRID